MIAPLGILGVSLQRSSRFPVLRTGTGIRSSCFSSPANCENNQDDGGENEPERMIVVVPHVQSNNYRDNAPNGHPLTLERMRLVIHFESVYSGESRRLKWSRTPFGCTSITPVVP